MEVGKRLAARIVRSYMQTSIGKAISRSDSTEGAESNRVEPNDRIVRSSRYERTLLNRLTRSSFQSRSAIWEEICVYIYMQYIWDHPRNTRKINFSRRTNGVDGPTPIDFHINVTFTKSLAVNRSALYIPLLSVFTFLVFHRELKVL